MSDQMHDPWHEDTRKRMGADLKRRLARLVEKGASEHDVLLETIEGYAFWTLHQSYYNMRARIKEERERYERIIERLDYRCERLEAESVMHTERRHILEAQLSDLKAKLQKKTSAEAAEDR